MRAAKEMVWKVTVELENNNIETFTAMPNEHIGKFIKSVKKYVIRRRNTKIKKIIERWQEVDINEKTNKTG